MMRHNVNYKKINIVLFSLLSLTLFASVFASVSGPVSAVNEVPITLNPTGIGNYYNDWVLYPSTSSLTKFASLADTDDSTGVTRVSNSKFQSVGFINSDSRLNGATITHVKLRALASNPGDAGSYINLMMIKGTTNKDWLFGPNIPVPTSSTYNWYQNDLGATNPVTGKAWTPADVQTWKSGTLNYNPGLNQQTKQNSAQIKVAKMEVVVYILNQPPKITQMFPPSGSLEAAPGGIAYNYSPPVATDDGTVSDTWCSLNSSSNGSDRISAATLYQYSPALPNPDSVTVYCFAKDNFDLVSNLDSSGNVAKFTVTTQDTTSPVISNVPVPLAVEGNKLNGANGPATAFALPTASDSFDGTVTVTCTKNPAGDEYSYNPATNPTPNTVICNTSDATGNTASASFIMPIKDTTAPTFTVDSTIVNWLRSTTDAPNPYDVNSDNRVTAFDIVAGDVTSRIVKSTDVIADISNVYTNTFSVDDPSGNIAAPDVTTNVNVVDIIPPTTISADDFATFYVDDYNADTPGSIVISTSTNPSVTYTFPLTQIAPGQFEATVEFVALDEGETLVPGQIPVTGGITVNAKYLDLGPRTSIVAPIGQAPGAFGGTPGLATDPFKFIESDVYYIGQFGTLSVDDTSIPTGTDSVSATISVGGSSTQVSLTRVTDTNTFTAQINFESVLPDNPIGQYVIVPDTGSQITASYGALTPITASIIPNPSLVPIDPVNFKPDSARKDVCANDADGDKICNEWEDQVLNGAGSGLKIPINGGGFYTFTCDAGKTIADAGYELGSRVCPQSNVKDVFVEVDYMANHYPSTTAIAQVVKSFKDNGGINLHVLIDEKVADHVNSLWFADPSNIIPEKTFVEIKEESFGTATERSICADPNSDPLSSGFACYTQIQNELAAKRQVFRYALYAHDQAEFPGSSGYAETPGNDMIISLGSFSGKVGSINQQAATFMHELGHTLGAQHGGANNLNCKPNYPSVMNYLYQFDNTANTGRPLNYSPVAYTTINEASLADTLVVNHGRSALYQRTLAIGGYTGALDASGIPLTPLSLSTFVTALSGTTTPYSSAGFGTWNRDGVTNTVAQNVHYFANIPGCNGADNVPLTSLASRNDWTALNYDMRNTPGWNSGIVSIVGKDTTIGFGDGGELDPDSIAFDVTLENAQVNEGNAYEPNISTLADPHGDSWTITMTYNDNNNVGHTQSTTVTRNGDNGAIVINNSDIDYTYLDDGTYNVHVHIVNDLGGVGDADATVTVVDTPPSVTSVSGGTVDEGTPFAGTAVFTKASVDTVGVNVNYGDSNPDDQITDATSPVSLDRTYTLAGTKTITVTATDDDGSTSVGTASVTVNNLPVGISIGSIGTIHEDETISGSGSVTVNSAYDSIVSATVDYGDGTNVPLDLTGNTFALSHKYTQYGTYTVTTTVTDDDGVSYTATTSVVVLVVYDNLAFEAPVPGAQYQQGRTIPIKFAVIEDGQHVANLAPQVYVKLADGSRSPVTGFITVPYVDTSVSYHYNLDSNGFPLGGTTLFVILDDGSQWSVTINIK